MLKVTLNKRPVPPAIMENIPVGDLDMARCALTLSSLFQAHSLARSGSAFRIIRSHAHLSRLISPGIIQDAKGG